MGIKGAPRRRFRRQADYGERDADDVVRCVGNNWLERKATIDLTTGVYGQRHLAGGRRLSQPRAPLASDIYKVVRESHQQYNKYIFFNSLVYQIERLQKYIVIKKILNHENRFSTNNCHFRSTQKPKFEFIKLY